MIIPDSVTNIGNYAFYGCYHLTSVTIPDSVTRIDMYAFADCLGITSVYFLGNAPSIVENAFSDVNATVYYPAGNATWTNKVRQNYGGTLTWEAFSSVATSGDFTGDGLVNNEDVAYLLWYTLFPEDYPVNANADFTGDGPVNNEDVAYLLWHTLFPEDYPI